MKTLFARIHLALSLALALAACALSPQALAQETSVCTTGYSVYFGNGIRYERTNSYLSADRVRMATGSTFKNEPVTVSVSINPTGGFLPDLVEVFSQKLAEDPTLSWQLFFRWVSGEFISSTLLVALDDYFGGSGSQRLAQAVGSLSSPAAYTDPTVIQHAGTYRDQLLAGKKVLLVSHSQGNLYANAIRGRLGTISNGINLSAYSNVAVATPANFVATGEGYVTSDTDLVIDLLRLLAPATLPDNDQSVPSFPSADRLGHGFVEIYTSNSYPSLKAKTFNLVNVALNRLSNVATQFASGPITATMTWSSPGDVDLHTYEPAAHVYYANLRGPVGYLDRDDVVGTGPEHYYAQCGTFRTGTYRFGANYYSGSGAKVTTISLSVLGTSYPARSITLTTPRGSGGNNSPAILFDVEITTDDTGAYVATVR